MRMKLSRCKLKRGKQAKLIELFVGEVEVDESYFGGVRKGKRGGGAAGKVVVLCLLRTKTILMG